MDAVTHAFKVPKIGPAELYKLSGALTYLQSDEGASYGGQIIGHLSTVAEGLTRKTLRDNFKDQPAAVKEETAVRLAMFSIPGYMGEKATFAQYLKNPRTRMDLGEALQKVKVVYSGKVLAAARVLQTIGEAFRQGSLEYGPEGHTRLGEYLDGAVTTANLTNVPVNAKALGISFQARPGHDLKTVQAAYHTAGAAPARDYVLNRVHSPLATVLPPLLPEHMTQLEKSKLGAFGSMEDAEDAVRREAAGKDPLLWRLRHDSLHVYVNHGSPFFYEIKPEDPH